MKDKPTNLPASVAVCLRNIARAKNFGLEFILRLYAIERLLHRVSLSPFRDRFVLKGAMPFTAWLDDPFRPTQNLDLSGFGDPAIETIAATYRAICQQETAEDGLVFDTEDLTVEPIRDDQQNRGVRVRSRAFLGRTRIPNVSSCGRMPTLQLYRTLKLPIIGARNWSSESLSTSTFILHTMCGNRHAGRPHFWRSLKQRIWLREVKHHEVL
jgi:hypothetical protein